MKKGIALLLTLVTAVVCSFALSVFAENTEVTYDEKTGVFTVYDKDTGTKTEYFGFSSLEEALEWENREQWDGTVPDPVVDPALIGTWGFHDEQWDLDLVWTFKADGTGNYYANGIDMPIASYVATNEPFSEYEEDGCLLTVYWAETTTVMGNTTHTSQLDPIEYGYIVSGDMLRIVFSRDIANDYTDYTRE